MGGLGYTLFAHCDIIPMLSHPIRQRKGGGSIGPDNIILGFRCGGRSQLLQGTTVTTSQIKAPEVTTPGLSLCVSIDDNIILS